MFDRVKFHSDTSPVRLNSQAVHAFPRKPSGTCCLLFADSWDPNLELPRWHTEVRSASATLKPKVVSGIDKRYCMHVIRGALRYVKLALSSDLLNAQGDSLGCKFSPCESGFASRESSKS